MKPNLKKATIVISLIFVSFLTVLTLVYYTGQNFESKVHTRLSQFNKSQGYQGQLEAYNKLESDYRSWQLILNINQKSKAEYENAKYEMKTNFEKRFLYLSSLISDQKNKINDQNEDIQSGEKSAMESNVQQQSKVYKDEVNSNPAFTEEEKYRLLSWLDKKES